MVGLLTASGLKDIDQTLAEDEPARPPAGNFETVLGYLADRYGYVPGAADGTVQGPVRSTRRPSQSSGATKLSS